MSPRRWHHECDRRNRLAAGPHNQGRVTLPKLTQQLDVAIQIGNARTMLLALAYTCHGQWQLRDPNKGLSNNE